MYLLALSIVQKVKRSLDQLQNYEVTLFLGPEWPIDPNSNFLGKSNNIFLSYLLFPFIV